MAPKPWVPNIRGGTVPGMLIARLTRAGSARKYLVEFAGLWEMLWSGVLGARRRRPLEAVKICEWRPMSGQPIWNKRQDASVGLVCVVNI